MAKNRITNFRLSVAARNNLDLLARKRECTRTRIVEELLQDAAKEELALPAGK